MKNKFIQWLGGYTAEEYCDLQKKNRGINDALRETQKELQETKTELKNSNAFIDEVRGENTSMGYEIEDLKKQLAQSKKNDTARGKDGKFVSTKPKKTAKPKETATK
jgi:regulator of replication initiation timing